jgi:hypothetical protein
LWLRKFLVLNSLNALHYYSKRIGVVVIVNKKFLTKNKNNQTTMYISIKIEKKREEGSFQELTRSPMFKIETAELLESLENCYTQLGTPYDPIKIDNFVTVGEDAFSLIDAETEVTVTLEPDSAEDYSNVIKDSKLVCCTVKVVDKDFVN